MKRKLCSLIMGAFAILLLMGAGVELDNGSPVITVQAADMTIVAAESQEILPAEMGMDMEDAEVYDPTSDESLLVDGEPVEADTKKTIVGGVSYVSLRAMAEELDATAVVNWDAQTETATVETESLHLTVGQNDGYLVANGRYLQMSRGLQIVDGVTMVPLAVLAEAFDATVQWDEATRTINVTSGSGAIQSGDSYYDKDEIFWMSRIIYAESGHETMEGRIAVGNVVQNRIASPAYPNTLLGVIAQRNQFSTYQNGNLANRTPNENSIIAAKLVLDGAVVEGLESASHFDTGGNTWAARNKTCLAVIGGHKFYG